MTHSQVVVSVHPPSMDGVKVVQIPTARVSIFPLEDPDSFPNQMMYSRYMYNLSSMFWVYLGVSYQFNVPRKPPEEVLQEAS